MRSGFLISRITNDTRMMQTALSSVSSDVFKQPVTIISGLGVLLYMDWKFTVVTMILFPSCLIPLRMYGRRARKAVQGEQQEAGQMVVTMQETFGGIRVVKSFGREEHQEKVLRTQQSHSIRQRDADCALDAGHRSTRRDLSPRSAWGWPCSMSISKTCRRPSSSP